MSEGTLLASASLSASLISFERRSNSCRVIRAGILASCANMSKWKETLRPFVICRIVPPFASLCPTAGMVLKPELVQLFPKSLAIVSRQGSGCTVTGTTFWTGCLPFARWRAVPLRQASPLLSH